MPRAFERVHSALIPIAMRGNLPILCQPSTFCVHHPAHSKTRRRLLKADLVREQSNPQGSGRCVRCFRPSAEATGRRFPTRGGVSGPCFVNLQASVCTVQGTTDGATADSNRLGTYEGWSPGLRKVCQMLQASSGGDRASIFHQRRGSRPCFVDLKPSFCTTQGITD